MSEKPVDYGDDVKVGPGNNILATIEHLASEALTAEAAVAHLEEELRGAKERYRVLTEVQLPEAMGEARQKELTTDSNIKIKIVDKVRASIPDVRKTAALDALRERGYGPIIKTRIEIPFEAGRDPAAQGLSEFLINLGRAPGFLQDIREGYAERFGLTPDIEAAFSFLTAIGNEGPDRIQLSSSVHSSTLAALVRELLALGKIDPPFMELIGAHAWAVAQVKLK